MLVSISAMNGVCGDERVVKVDVLKEGCGGVSSRMEMIPYIC
jgi:hypothetical protein